MSQIAGKRVVVTGGSGFLGSQVCNALAKLHPAEVIVPRKVQYDLTEQSLVRKLLDDARPDVIIHLAAVVGSIGANLESPGRYFYENAHMLQLNSGVVGGWSSVTSVQQLAMNEGMIKST